MKNHSMNWMTIKEQVYHKILIIICCRQCLNLLALQRLYLVTSAFVFVSFGVCLFLASVLVFVGFGACICWLRGLYLLASGLVFAVFSILYLLESVFVFASSSVCAFR